MAIKPKGTLTRVHTSLLQKKHFALKDSPADQNRLISAIASYLKDPSSLSLQNLREAKKKAVKGGCNRE